MKPTLNLFWTYYKLTTTIKSPSFFSIGLNIGSQKWIKTQSNIRGSHSEWFYLIGPDLERFSRWDEFTPNACNPSLTPPKEATYHKLLRNYDPSKILSAV